MILDPRLPSSPDDDWPAWSRAGVATSYAAGTQALRDKLDARLEAQEADAQAAADEWAARRHPFTADEYGTSCALCWRSFRGHP